MSSAPLPPDEDKRLAALRSFQILDTPSDPRFDAFTRVAARLFDAPVALISLVDQDRQWFKSSVGLDLSQTPRDQAFCAHSLLQPEGVFLVEDAANDPRFADNPLVTGELGIRFYAGAPLVDSEGNTLGTLCVIGQQPRKVSEEELAPLKDLAAGVVSTLELHRILAQTQRAAMHDPLTGLANRARFDQELARLAETGAASGKSFALLGLDLDRFKQINDTLGHAGGDAVLKETAARLLASVRGPDLVARIGGDEFAILLPDTPDGRIAERVATRMLDKLAEPFSVGGQAVPIRGSIGVAVYPEDACGVDALIRHADAALYRAKRHGRGHVQRFATEMGDRPREGAGLEADLDAAVEQQFTLAWHPFARVTDRAVVGFEVRPEWHRPGHGKVAADSFMPQAETCGLAARLDQWVLQALRRQVVAPEDPPLVAFRISDARFRQGDLAGLVAAMLDGGALDPARLEIEIREPHLIDQPEHALTELRRLKDMGVGLVLTDFATGFSSLRDLGRYGFDKVKLDAAFVAGLGQRAEADAIADTVLHLGAALGMQVRADGVATEQQFARLSAAGCAEVQGSLIGAVAERSGLKVLSAA